MAIKPFQIGDIKISWLNGGIFRLDGGAMFGPVPKTIWAEHYPADKENCIKLKSSPLLIQTPKKTILVETGIGNKLTDRQRKMFKVEEPWNILDDLADIGMKREDIDYVILTHCDFDHAGGAVMRERGGKSGLTFPNAEYFIQRMEWEDAQAPNLRASNTYLPANFQGLDSSGKLVLVDGNREVCEGIEVLHTGGHTRGHQIVKISSRDKIAYYLADLLPTHIHFKPSWIMAYDNYPLDVIRLKDELEKRILSEGGWHLFYHDPFLNACRFDDKGEVIERWPLPKQVKMESKTVNQKSGDIQKIHVGKARELSIGCPYCKQHRMVAVDKFMGKKHFLNIKCTCGGVFGVELNFRQHHRKAVSIGGYYGLEGKGNVHISDMGGIPTIPVNCEIKNISRGGLAFSPLNPISMKKGDRITICFTLDKQPPEYVEREVVVKTVKNNYIGCEFASASDFDTTLGFYLMK